MPANTASLSTLIAEMNLKSGLNLLTLTQIEDLLDKAYIAGYDTAIGVVSGANPAPKKTRTTKKTTKVAPAAEVVVEPVTPVTPTPLGFVKPAAATEVAAEVAAPTFDVAKLKALMEKDARNCKSKGSKPYIDPKGNRQYWPSANAAWVGWGVMSTGSFDPKAITPDRMSAIAKDYGLLK